MARNGQINHSCKGPGFDGGNLKLFEKIRNGSVRLILNFAEILS
jgi:hypothetical protein